MPHMPPIILPDTNFLLDYPSVHKEDWQISPVEIWISETVLGELRGLAKRTDGGVAVKAQAALDEIESYLGSMSALIENRHAVTIKMVDRCTEQVRPLDSQKPDHQLIACARKELHGMHPRFCAILSNDKELCDIAEALAVIAVSRRNGLRFHQELQTKYEWWVKSQLAAAEKPAVSQKVELPVQRRPSTSKQVLLSRSVKKLYRRINAVGCRTTIYLAPLKMRLALTLEIIQRLRQPEKHAVIVVVENRAAVHYWAGEIRQQGGYSSHEVQIFGTDQVDRMDQARVVIYRHDQIARRLPQHVARLTQADKRITAVVDGCDILDPVELAILLYECDQFIGLNHLPLGYRQSRGHRMLSVTLRNRALIDYSFADAERDGWGRSCDLYLHKVDFTPLERQEWDNISADYIRRRERALASFPELGEADNFWEALERLLDRTANPELVDLIKNREQQEQMAQLAQGKLEQVKQLFHLSLTKPHRRLVFDYARQWTPVLLKQLPLEGASVAEFPGGEQQRTIWEQFAGNRLDTLLLSSLPAWDLPPANIQQIIILTPLRPMDEVLAMIDWALDHTQIGGALRLSLLYVDDTPEEIAMLELAEASFGLR